MSSTPSLCITGHPISLIKDDINALYIDQGSHLILWGSDSDKQHAEDIDLWIDRYDVRILLSEYNSFCFHQQDRYTAAPDADEEDDIMYERYQDLLDANEEDLQPVSVDSHHNEDKKTVTKEETQFVKPHDINFPSDMPLPVTEKQFHIIVHTAKATRGNRQLEVLLKVKQSNNKLFEFLNDDTPLHALYKYLLDLSEAQFWGVFLRRRVGDAESSGSSVMYAEKVPNNALSLLGEYTDSEDEDCGNAATDGPRKEVKMVASPLHFRDDGTDKVAPKEGSTVSAEEGDSFTSQAVSDIVSLKEPVDVVAAVHESDHCIPCGVGVNSYDGVKKTIENEIDYLSESDDGFSEDVEAKADRFWCAGIKRRRLERAKKKADEEQKNAAAVRAERLKRAKMLAGHFLLSATEPSNGSTESANSDRCSRSTLEDGETQSRSKPIRDTSRSRSAERSTNRSRSRSRERHHRSYSRGRERERRSYKVERDASRDRERGRSGRNRRSISRSRSSSIRSRRKRDRSDSSRSDRRARSRNRSRYAHSSRSRVGKRPDTELMPSDLIDSSKLFGKVKSLLESME